MASWQKYGLVVLFVLISAGVAVAQTLKVGSPLRFLALGDSYTIGQGVSVEERWPSQLVKRLEAFGVSTEKLTFIAQTGWRTDNLLNAINAENPDPDYNMVSLLIGVNNQYQGAAISAYPGEFRQLLQKAIYLCGGNKEGVFVLSIPDYGYTPFGASSQASISAEIDSYNAINQQIANEFGVGYYNITPISRETVSRSDYLASDQLHPSGEMYKSWVSFILNSSGIELITSGAEIEQEAQEVVVYPNPVRNKLTILVPQNGLMLSMHNNLGRRIYQAPITGNKQVDIDVSEWPRGMYFYQIQQKLGVTFSGKIILH